MLKVQVGVDAPTFAGDFLSTQLNCPLCILVGGKKSGLGALSELNWIRRQW